MLYFCNNEYMFVDRLKCSEEEISLLQELNKKINNILFVHNKVPPTPWKCKTENRGYKAQRRSLLWILGCLTWHCQTDNNFQQLIGCLAKYFNRNDKHLSMLTDEQCNEIQTTLNITVFQMRQLRRLLRKFNGRMVIISEPKLKQYQNNFKLSSAEIHCVNLELTATEKKKQKSTLVHKAYVYHCDVMEVLQRLLEESFLRHKYYIQKPLNPNEYIVEIGWDKSDGGLAETVSLGVTKHYHNQLGSIVTTLTDDKIAENYSNYRELAIQWNKQDITNRLLKFPNMIIIVQYVAQNNKILSKKVSAYVMSFSKRIQKQWDERKKSQLISKPSPTVANNRLTDADITNAMNGSKCTLQTKQFWVQKSKIEHIEPYYCVELTPKFESGICSDIKYDNKLQTYEQLVTWWENKDTEISLDDNKSSSSESESTTDDDADSQSERYNLRGIQHQYIEHSDHESDLTVKMNPDATSEYNFESDYSVSNINYSTYASDSEDDKSIYASDISEISEIERTYALNTFAFNQNSPLNRMTESQWRQECKHVRASNIQGDKIFALDLSMIVEESKNDPQNSYLTLTNGQRCQTNLDKNLLFNDSDGIVFFWINVLLIPKPHNRRKDKTVTVAIIDNNCICGLLVLFIPGVKNLCDIDILYMQHVKAFIQQRSTNYKPMDIQEALWHKSLSYKYISQCKDYNLLQQIGSTAVEFESDTYHKMCYFSMELEGYLQFDNKGKNITGGYSTGSCSNPCAICYVPKKDILKLPNPCNMSFGTRTTEETVKYASMVTEGTKHIKGCQKSPIYDVPAHKRGPTCLHEHQGIYYIIITTMRDCIVKLTEEKNDMNQESIESLQKKSDELATQYNDVVRLQDLIQMIQTYDKEEENQRKENLIHELKAKRLLFEKANKEFGLYINQNVKNNCVIKYFEILKKYKIDLNYGLQGSVQGVICTRFNNAADELIQLLQSINASAALLFRLLMNNISYIYSMLKNKTEDKWTYVDCLSLKQAYLDFYHQFVIAVGIWRKKGKVGNKVHLLLHDLEHAWSKLRSPAFEDDQRFENCNQLIKLIRRLYDKYFGKDKMLLMGNRMNNHTFTSKQGK